MLAVFVLICPLPWDARSDNNVQHSILRARVHAIELEVDRVAEVVGLSKSEERVILIHPKKAILMLVPNFV